MRQREKGTLRASILDRGAGGLLPIQVLQRVAVVLAKAAAARRKLRFEIGEYSRAKQREAEQHEQQHCRYTPHGSNVLSWPLGCQ
jgi:hypothetical protein